MNESTVNELAARLRALSPEARFILEERTRWWPREDGGVRLAFRVPDEELEAALELRDAFLVPLGMEMAHLPAGAGREEPPPGDGLTLDEWMEWGRARRRSEDEA